MPLPIVAIVGRPNVGKSSLFNALSRERRAIVEPTAGVTRDRVSTVTDVDGLYFELVDTGGLGIVDRDDLDDDVERQILRAVDQACLIFLVVDARDGLTALDRRAAELLRPSSDRVRLLANKVDEPHMTGQVFEFSRLGFGEPYHISAMSMYGIRGLREEIAQRLADPDQQAPVDPLLRVALLGKRNAGKSTFVNRLAGEERVIVSEIPGTTRDSIDVRFERDGRAFMAIDTAGVRKKQRLADDIEYYAYTRAIHAMERADVALLLIDSTVPVAGVDKRLAQLIHAAYKPCVIVVNKWDLARDRSDTAAYSDYLDKMLPEIDFVPVSFTAATDGWNVFQTIDVAFDLFRQSDARVTTGQLNQTLRDAVDAHAPPMGRGRKRAKFFYVTQVSTRPPTFVLFVNDPRLVTRNYERFLMNRFRESLPFEEIPIRLMFRARRHRSAPL